MFCLFLGNKKSDPRAARSASCAVGIVFVKRSIGDVIRIGKPLVHAAHHGPDATYIRGTPTGGIRDAATDTTWRGDTSMKLTASGGATVNSFW